MRTARTVGVGSLLVAATLAAVACGPDDDPGVTTTTPTTAPQAATVTVERSDVTAAPAPSLAAPSTAAPETSSPRSPMPTPVAGEGSVRDVIARQPELSNIDAAIEAWLADVPGREGVLRNARGVTMFLPSDDGFTADDLAAALRDLDAFTIFLSEHLRVGTLASDEFGTEVKTAMGAVYVVTEGPAIGGRRIVRADIEATNGVVHVIDGPLVPLAGGG